MEKETFIEIFKKNISRPGCDEMLCWLLNSDFFVAPASTRFHLAVEKGLLKHSIHVYSRLRELYIAEVGSRELTSNEEETIAIVGLLHDVCKVNFYGTEMRNRKNEHGFWEKVPFYTINDKVPYGHGEKSAFIVSQFMKLSLEEAMAIRWHMGFSDNEFKAGGHTVGNAFNMFPLAVMAHIADLQATFLDESGM